MATWISHLRIADNLLKLLPGLDNEQFAIGNIAPDSGIPDEKWEKFNPPGEVTHFKANEKSKVPLADLEFYRHYLALLPWPGTDSKRYSFLTGYFFHLITDNLWSAIISDPTRERYKAQFDADRGFIWEVKKDWYGLDFVYVRSHPDALYWRVFLNCEYTTHYLDFLMIDGVKRNIDHIKEYYQRTDSHAEELVAREWVYLTEAKMNNFVDSATEIIFQSWNQLKEGNLNSDDLLSVLEKSSISTKGY